MRIGVNTLPLFPGQIGGTEAYAHNLLSHLTAIDRQHAYYLFVARYNRNLFDFHLQRANVFKVKKVRLALKGVLKGDEALTDEILELVKNQNEY